MKLLYEINVNILMLESEVELSVDEVSEKMSEFNVDPVSITKIEKTLTPTKKYLYQVNSEWQKVNRPEN